MERKDYEKFTREKISVRACEVSLEQIDNFYNLEGKQLKNRKYKLGADVILGKNILMTGFKADKEYLELVAKEGKICGDFATSKAGTE